MSEKAKKTVSNEQLWEFKPDTNVIPAPLTFQSTLMETHHFYAQFERYVKTSNSLPDGIVYSQATVNMDKFWLKQIEDRDFGNNTSLQDFIFLIKDVILSKFSLETRQAALFDAKQQDIEDPADFLETLTNMISSADWTNISPEQATCYIFIQICVHFLQEGKNNLHELKEELKKSKTQQPKTDIICNTCLLWGHKEEQCYGQCNHCLNWGHHPKNCS